MAQYQFGKSNKVVERYTATGAYPVSANDSIYRTTNYIKKSNSWSNVQKNITATNLASGRMGGVVEIDTNKLFYLYQITGTNALTAKIGTFDSDTGVITYTGNTTILTATGNNYDANICKLDTNKVAIVYKTLNTPTYSTGVIIATISGTTITVGSPVDIYTTASADFTGVSVCKVATDKIAVAYIDVSTSSYARVSIATVSGTVPTFGTAVTYKAVASDAVSVCSTEDNKIMATCNATTSWVACATISGTVPTFGTAVDWSGSSVTRPYICSIGIDRTIIGHVIGTNGIAVIIKASGTTLTYGASVVFQTTGPGGYASIIKPNNNTALIVYTDAGDGDKIKYVTTYIDDVDLLTFSTPVQIAGVTSAVLLNTSLCLLNNNIAVIAIPITSTSNLRTQFANIIPDGVAQSAECIGSRSTAVSLF